MERVKKENTMERLKLRYDDAVRALDTLQSILKEPYSVVIRDATIQRFEYTFEAVWKFLKGYLKEKEGVVANTPKSVFRQIGVLGVLTEEKVVRCLEMTDRRNDTVHTYKEEVAKMIYEEIEEYTILIHELLKKISFQ